MKKSIGSGRGSVYNILLKALQSGDKYGYEICKEVEEKTNGDYILKQASLYSGLKRLEAQSEITSYWKDSALGGRRHYYSLTEKGKMRIENSNFSWKDTRDEIMNNLFEKSELDKAVDDAQKDIIDLKEISDKTQLQSNDIDAVIKDTSMLSNTNNDKEAKNQEPEKTEKTFGDLFSMVSTAISEQNDYTATSNLIDKDKANTSSSATNSQRISDKNDELEKDIDNKQSLEMSENQLDLLSFANSQIEKVDAPQCDKDISETTVKETSYIKEIENNFKTQDNTTNPTNRNNRDETTNSVNQEKQQTFEQNNKLIDEEPFDQEKSTLQDNLTLDTIAISNTYITEKDSVEINDKPIESLSENKDKHDANPITSEQACEKSFNTNSNEDKDNSYRQETDNDKSNIASNLDHNSQTQSENNFLRNDDNQLKDEKTVNCIEKREQTLNIGNQTNNTDLESEEKNKINGENYLNRNKEESITNADISSQSSEDMAVRNNSNNQVPKNKSINLDFSANQANNEIKTENQSGNDKIVYFEKNTHSAVDEYKKSHINLNSFMDSTCAQTASKSFFTENDGLMFQSNDDKEVSSNEKVSFIPEKDIHTSAEKPDITLNINTVEEKVIADKNNDTSTAQDEKIENTNINNVCSNSNNTLSSSSTTSSVPTQEAIDYRDIFGELMSNGNNIERTASYNTKENKSEEQPKDSSDLEKISTNMNSSTKTFKELPRDLNAIKDINKTLQINSSHSNTISSNTNAFEKYDTSPFESVNYKNIEKRFGDNNNALRQDSYDISSANESEIVQPNIETNNISQVPFDKKFSNSNNTFEIPGYQIRYYKKPTLTKKTSKFISINKLNLACSFILCLFICICTSCVLFITQSKCEINLFQKIVYIISYLIPIFSVIFNFTRYFLNKEKKVQKLNHSEMMINTFISILLVILSIAINLFMGMKISNILEYSGSFIIPICYSIAFILSFLVKKLLSKSHNFYN